MTGLQTVPCHIVGMGLGIVYLVDKIASNSLLDRQDVQMKDNTHKIFACECVPKYMYAK